MSLLEEAYTTLGELVKMHKLNQELLETLSVTAQWLRSYAEKHNISLSNSSTFDSLINKATALLNEIQAGKPNVLQYRKLADEKKHTYGTDEEEPVPFIGPYPKTSRNPILLQPSQL